MGAAAILIDGLFSPKPLGRHGGGRLTCVNLPYHFSSSHYSGNYRGQHDYYHYRNDRQRHGLARKTAQGKRVG
jgi:hypothetical protein